MIILDKSKIRADILKIIEDPKTVRANEMGVAEFLKKKENQIFDFNVLWQKLMEGNACWLRGEDMSGYLTKGEQLFLARFLRYTWEYLADFRQKHVSPIPKDVKCEQVDAGGVPAEWQTVPGAIKDRVLLYFHGGGYIMGSPNTRRSLTVMLGKATNMRVLSVDYSLAPEHPYPAALEDCTTVYNWLLSRGFKSRNIIIAGDSAGGYFTLMTLVRLRNGGTSLPAGAACLSPGTDLAFTTIPSESYIENAPTDPVVADLGIFWWAEAYLAGADPHSPLISPLYADLTGLPPILIQVSTTEMLYDDSTRFVERAKAAGVDVTLQTWDDTLHVFQAFALPESKEAITKISEFIQKQFE